MNRFDGPYEPHCHYVPPDMPLAKGLAHDRHEEQIPEGMIVIPSGGVAVGTDEEGGHLIGFLGPDGLPAVRVAVDKAGYVLDMLEDCIRRIREKMGTNPEAN